MTSLKTAFAVKNTAISEVVFLQLVSLKVVSLNETKAVYNNAKIGAELNSS